MLVLRCHGSGVRPLLSPRGEGRLRGHGPFVHAQGVDVLLPIVEETAEQVHRLGRAGVGVAVQDRPEVEGPDERPEGRLEMISSSSRRVVVVPRPGHVEALGEEEVSSAGDPRGAA